MSITLSALQKQRTDTAANWTAENPTLLSGELGFESDTGKAKLGTGSTAWNSLGYLGLIPSSGIYPLSQLLMPSGTQAAPSLSFNGDTDTGLYRTGANAVAISTGGSGRLFVDSNGRLGIGTSSPSYQFHVSNTGANALGVFTRTSGASVYIEGSSTLGNIGTVGSHNLGFTTNSTTAMTIDTSQRVGIGTTSPAQLLHLNSPSANATQWIAAGTGYTSNLSLLANGSGGGLLLSSATDSSASITNSLNAALIFGTNNTERARIDSSGRLLVGTSSARGGWYNSTGTSVSPVIQTDGTSFNTSSIALAHNENTANEAARILLGKSRGTTAGSFTVVQNGDDLGGIAFQGADGTNFVEGAHIKAFVDGAPGANDMPGRLVFSTTADGASSPTERMRIGNDGNVSLGLAAPSTYRLGLTVPSGADRDIFLTGVSGATNGLQVNWVHATTSLSVKFNNILTTAAAANAFLDSGDANRIYRSTSSLRYKKDVENIEQLKADAILGLRPVWYRSKAANDRSDWSWYGLIAEEVAAVEPRLVHWTYLDEDYEIEEIDGTIKKTPKPDAELVPDGVQYDRLTVLLLDVVKRQNERIEALEAKVATLEAS